MGDATPTATNEPSQEWSTSSVKVNDPPTKRQVDELARYMRLIPCAEDEERQRWELLLRFMRLLVRHPIRTWSTTLLQVVVPVAEHLLGASGVIEDSEHFLMGKPRLRAVR